jgi:dUTP pyrophosphatase
MKIEIIDKGAVAKGRLPQRAKPMDAGADIFAPRDWNLESGQTIKLPLGFGVRIPNGFAAFVYPRGSMSQKGITCQLCPIDASYTGEVHAIVTNESNDSFYIKEGDKIGQLVIFPCIIADFVTEPLEERGTAAFGSTGK